MILYRCSALDRDAGVTDPDGPLWFPRVFQGSGRHDNPDRYGCLYVAETAVAGVVESLARFRGTTFSPAMLRRRGLPLALVELELGPAAAETLVDLDDPAILLREALTPSRVATRQRAITQVIAADLWATRSEAAGLRWWSTFEASWLNVTLFDRGARHLGVVAVRELSATDSLLTEARELLGL